MNWSAEQQRLLGAMGYTLYRRGSVDAAPVLAAETPDTPSVPRAARAAGSGSPEKLLAALQRAAPGRDVIALAGDIDALRRDPMKKRALWPTLRALRRAH